MAKYPTPKERGYVQMNLSPEIIKILDEVKKEEMCKTRAEALRRIVALFKKNYKFMRYRLYIFLKIYNGRYYKRGVESILLGGDNELYASLCELRRLEKTLGCFANSAQTLGAVHVLDGNTVYRLCEAQA